MTARAVRQATRSRYHRVREGRETGTTLAELLVTMVVGVAVLLAAGTIFAALNKGNALTTVRNDSYNTAKVSVESMTRNLRTAVQPNQLDDAASTDVAFVQGGPKGVSFYANIDNVDNRIGPSRVTYQVDANNRLIQTVQKPNAHTAENHNYQYCDPTLAGCVARVVVLAQGLDPSVDLFTYYDDKDAKLAFAELCSGAPCLAADVLGIVNSVEIKVVVRPQTTMSTGATTYISRVSLPNRESILRGIS